MLFDQLGALHGISKDLGLVFGLSRAFYEHMTQVQRTRTYYLSQLFPELDAPGRLESLRTGAELLLRLDVIAGEDDKTTALGQDQLFDVIIQVYYSCTLRDNKTTLYYAYMFKNEEMAVEVKSGIQPIETDTPRLTLMTNRLQQDVVDEQGHDTSEKLTSKDEIVQLKQMYIKRSIRNLGTPLSLLSGAFIAVVLIGLGLNSYLGQFFGNNFFIVLPGVSIALVKGHFSLWHALYNLDHVFYNSAAQINANLAALHSDYGHINGNATLTNAFFYSNTFASIPVAVRSAPLYFFNSTANISHASNYTPTMNTLASYAFVISRANATNLANSASVAHRAVFPLARTIWATGCMTFFSNFTTYFGAVV